jgi:hypothetical protein
LGYKARRTMPCWGENGTSLKLVLKQLFSWRLRTAFGVAGSAECERKSLKWV